MSADAYVHPVLRVLSPFLHINTSALQRCGLCTWILWRVLHQSSAHFTIILNTLEVGKIISCKRGKHVQTVNGFSLSYWNKGYYCQKWNQRAQYGKLEGILAAGCMVQQPKSSLQTLKPWAFLKGHFCLPACWMFSQVAKLGQDSNTNLSLRYYVTCKQIHV